MFNLLTYIDMVLNIFERGVFRQILQDTHDFFFGSVHEEILSQRASAGVAASLDLRERRAGVASPSYGNGSRLCFASSMKGPGKIPSARVAKAQKAMAPTRAGALSGVGVVWSESFRYM